MSLSTRMNTQILPYKIRYISRFVDVSYLQSYSRCLGTRHTLSLRLLVEINQSMNEPLPIR